MIQLTASYVDIHKKLSHLLQNSFSIDVFFNNLNFMSSTDLSPYYESLIRFQSFLYGEIFFFFSSAAFKKYQQINKAENIEKKAGTFTEILPLKCIRLKEEKKVFFVVINKEMIFQPFVDDVPFKINEEKCTRNETMKRSYAALSAAGRDTKNAARRWRIP